MVPAADLPALPASVSVWALAIKLALDLGSRERAVPALVRQDGMVFARWRAAPSAPQGAEQVSTLARSMPPAAHAVAAGGQAREVWAPEALPRAFLDATVDAFVGPGCRRGASTTERAEAAPDGRRRRTDTMATALDCRPVVARWRIRSRRIEPAFRADRTALADAKPESASLDPVAPWLFLCDGDAALTGSGEAVVTQDGRIIDTGSWSGQSRKAQRPGQRAAGANMPRPKWQPKPSASGPATVSAKVISTRDPRRSG